VSQNAKSTALAANPESTISRRACMHLRVLIACVAMMALLQAADPVPEWDGWSIVKKDNALLEMKLTGCVPVWFTRSQNDRVVTWRYETNVVKIKADDFKGIIVRGMGEEAGQPTLWKGLFTIDDFIPKERDPKSENEYQGIFSNYSIPGVTIDTLNQRIWMFSNGVETRCRKVSDGVFYWQPTQPLKPGKYAVMEGPKRERCYCFTIE